MINIRNFIIGVIISFGSICLGLWFGNRNGFLDFILIVIMGIGVPSGLLIACYPKDDVKRSVSE